MRELKINQLVKNNFVCITTMLLTVVLINACGGGSGSSDKKAEKFGLINIEIDHENPLIQVSQLNFDGSTSSTGRFSCQVTDPLMLPGIFECIDAEYDTALEEIVADVVIEGNSGELYIDVSSAPVLFVDLDDGVNFWQGYGKYVDTSLLVRTHMNSSGIQSTTFVLMNPQLGSASASLTGPGLASPLELWNNSTGDNYVDIYRSFNEFSLTDGIPQTNGAFVVYNNFDNGNVADDQRMTAGQYTVSVAGSSPYSHTVTYNRPDASNLFPPMGLPPARSDITFSDNTTDHAVSGADIDTPVSVGNGPYAITWTSDVASPSSVRWQIIFQQLDGNDQIENHLQARTGRLNWQTSSDLSFDSLTHTWTWDPNEQQAEIEAGTKVRVILRVTDTDNTMRAHSQPFYITR